MLIIISDTCIHAIEFGGLRSAEMVELIEVIKVRDSISWIRGKLEKYGDRLEEFNKGFSMVLMLSLMR